MNLTHYFAGWVLCAMLLVACGTSAPIDDIEATPLSTPDSIKAVKEPQPRPTETEALPNAVTFSDSAVQWGNGLRYEDLVDGEGAEAKANDLLTIHYTGYFEDGTLFNSSTSSGPYSFLLGAGQVIKGWEEGIGGMKVGGKRKLLIPAELAYGQMGSREVPPNSTLLFDIQLLNIEPLPSPAVVESYKKRENGMKMAILQEGDGAEAVSGDLISYNYNAWLENGVMFDNSTQSEVPVEAVLGQSALASLDEGIEGMKVGEVRQLRLPPELAYGEQGLPNYVPPNSTVIFEIHLLDNLTNNQATNVSEPDNTTTESTQQDANADEEADQEAKAKQEAEEQAKAKQEAEEQAKAEQEAEEQAKAEQEAEEQAKAEQEAEKQAKADKEAEDEQAKADEKADEQAKADKKAEDEQAKADEKADEQAKADEKAEDEQAKADEKADEQAKA
ncbi:MAG: FKBP-type peptidyl-prolyl cis-trans isomerase, partial [Ardenticatenaceae bacterium]